MEDCIFCKIVNKELEGMLIYEDEDIAVFPDKFPRAPVHFLIIPKKHIRSILEADADILGRMLVRARSIAKERNIDDFRLAMNAGSYQEVPHLHLHLTSE